MYLDQLKIRTKLILIYVVCVLTPLIATNTLVLFLVQQSERREQKSIMMDGANRIEYEINQRVNHAISVSDYLYRDEGLNQFLEQPYQDGTDYYEHFNQLMQNNVIRYYYTAQSVYEITIWTENDTITSGGYFQRKKDALDTYWYQSYRKGGRATAICAYYEKDNPYLTYVNRARRIAIIRKMDYEGSDDILKLDIDYLELTESIQNESGIGDIYLCDKEKIIYSLSETIAGGEEFLPLEKIQKKECQVIKEIQVLGSQWQILITADPYSFWEGMKGKEAIFFLLLIINLILPSIMIVLMNRSFRDRVALTGEYLGKVEQGQYEEIYCREGADEIGNLIRSYNVMVVRVKELIEDVYQKNAEKQTAELSRKQAELNALQSQMNPHFMFNTLESIRMRSLVKGEEETAEIMEKFASLLRRAVRWDSDFVKISKEAEDVRAYLDIQKYRFGERLAYSVYVQKECEDTRIPKFGLLTLVENACVHGIEKSVEGGSITVVVSGDEEHMFLEVMDSGNGMSQEELKKLRERIAEASIQSLDQAGSIGILNTVVRLKLYYDGKVEFDINSMQGEGTEVCVKLPLIYKQELEKN